MKFEVTIVYPVFVTAVVEAESHDGAIHEAWDKTEITSYAGNGGIDQLVGVRDMESSIEPGETPLETEPFEPTARRIE